MQYPTSLTPEARARLYARATHLALFTIGYNLIEGLVSVFFGLEDGTVALFGFGLDSFVEVISGVGIWHMMRRLRASADGEGADEFEKTALRVTGAAQEPGPVGARERQDDPGRHQRGAAAARPAASVNGP